MSTEHCQFDELGEHQLATPPDTHDKVVPPLKWHGGKYYLFKTILALFPPHLHYVEPFFGSGQVLFGRDPEDPRLWWTERTSDGRQVDGVSEVVNDIDRNLMNFYEVLRAPALFEKLQHRLEFTPFSEAEWEAAGELLKGKEGDRIERAASLFISVRQSRQALREDFVTPVRSRLRGGRQEHVNAWLSAVEGLEAVHRRLRCVLQFCRPAVEVIESEDSRQTLFYCDPPYLHEIWATPPSRRLLESFYPYSFCSLRFWIIRARRLGMTFVLITAIIFAKDERI